MSRVVELLEPLVRERSDRASGGETKLARVLERELARRGADEVRVVEVAREEGAATAYVFARFGTPRLLVNAHLDTVPPNAGWSADPFVLRVVAGHASGLGACDTKGAVAAILAALERVTPRDTLVLFSGDEEHGNVAMRSFLASAHARGLERAVVCEPTSLAVGTRHRGIVVVEASAASEGGHSSRADLVASPLADLARLAVRLDDFGRARRDVGPSGFRGLCVNIGRIDGGVAFNVIPTSARLEASLRPPPGADVDELIRELASLSDEASPLRFPISNPPFQTRDPQSFASHLGARVEHPVDLAFWTEAALLSQAGIDAVVFGPGDIAQAHAPDEHVAIAELDAAADVFASLFRATGSADAAR